MHRPVTPLSSPPLRSCTVTVIAVTVAGFEWPVPTHGAIFSIPDLKSKPGMPGCGGTSARLKIARMKQSVGHRIFLLSPAYAGGERARMILRDQAQFPLARRLREKKWRANRGGVHFSERPLFSRKDCLRKCICAVAARNTRCACHHADTRPDRCANANSSR